MLVGVLMAVDVGVDRPSIKLRLQMVPTIPLDEHARRDLHEAMKQIAETGHGPKEQVASMGCSIKWREAA